MSGRITESSPPWTYRLDPVIYLELEAMELKFLKPDPGFRGERNVNPASCGAFDRRRVCGAEDKTHRFSVYDIR